jgi:hypothetical protein
MTDEAIAKWVKRLPPDDGSGPIVAGGPMSHPIRHRSDKFSSHFVEFRLRKANGPPLPPGFAVFRPRPKGSQLCACLSHRQL